MKSALFLKCLFGLLLVLTFDAQADQLKEDMRDAVAECMRVHSQEINRCIQEDDRRKILEQARLAGCRIEGNEISVPPGAPGILRTICQDLIDQYQAETNEWKICTTTADEERDCCLAALSFNYARDVLDVAAGIFP